MDGTVSLHYALQGFEWYWTHEEPQWNAYSAKSLSRTPSATNASRTRSHSGWRRKHRNESRSFGVKHEHLTVLLACAASSVNTLLACARIAIRAQFSIGYETASCSSRLWSTSPSTFIVKLLTLMGCISNNKHTNTLLCTIHTYCCCNTLHFKNSDSTQHS